MNYKKILNIAVLFFGSLRSLASVAIFIAALFFSWQLFQKNNLSIISDSYAQPALPHCSDLSDDIDANPGANCLIRGMPRCGGFTTLHRENCYDPIDLPTCDLISNPSERKNLKNCVYQCCDSYFSDNGITPVHNSNCVNFCGTTCSANAGFSCVNRKCHQLSPYNSLSSSCSGGDLVRCDRLWPIEHSSWTVFMSSDPSPVFSGSAPGSIAPLYCNNMIDSTTRLKCHQLDYESLQFVNITNSNAPCFTHNCGPSADWIQLLSKTPQYRIRYNQNIGLIFPTDTPDGTDNPFTDSSEPGYPGSCSAPPAVPQTQFTEPFPCSSSATTETFTGSITSRVYRNSSCDSSGPGATCRSGYCYRSFSCDTTPRDPMCPTDSPPPTPPAVLPGGSLPSCSTVRHPIVPNPGVNCMNPAHNYTSWFHRPAPSGKATYVDGATGRRYVDFNIGNSSNLCINKNWRAVGTKPGDYHFNQTGYRGRYSSFDTLLFGTLHFFYYDLFEPSLSPGVCGMGSAGHRGIGYIYLKGPNGLLYNNLDNDTMYYDNEVTTRYEGERAIHSVRICARFRNTICVQCEGRRECVPTSGSTLIRPLWTQACGKDKCETFTITIDPSESDLRLRKGHGCMFDSEEASMASGCVDNFDGYLRMRAVYHNDDVMGPRICGYLDVKGHLGHDPHLIRPSNASEHIDKDNRSSPCRARSRYVKDQSTGEYDCSGGFDEESRSYSKWLAHKWRNVLKAEYVIDNQGGSGDMAGRGYFDADRNFHYKEACAPIMRRVGSVFYNVATVTNSPTILNPPVFIHSVISNDFYRPELRAHYGLVNITSYADGSSAPVYSCYGDSLCRNNSRILSSRLSGHNQIYLSLAGGELDGDTVYQAHIATYLNASRAGGRVNAPAYSYIASEIPGVSQRVTTELFLRKSYDFAAGKPNFCLYQKTKDADGEYTENPLKIGCRYRTEPYSTVYFNRSGYNNRVRVSARDPLNSSRIIQTDTAIIDVTDIDNNYCSQAIESYNFCMRRDLCTKLSRECPQAAVDRSIAVINGGSSIAYDSIVRECENVIRPQCLQMRGLDPDSTNPDLDIIKTNDFGAFRCRNDDNLYLEGVLYDPADPSADYDIQNCQPGEDPFKYGWFNNIYVSRGFSGFSNFKVKAHRTSDGSMGICKIDVARSSNLQDNEIDPSTGSPLLDSRGRPVRDLSTHCLGGGYGRNNQCVCERYPTNHQLTAEESRSFYLRDPTPREAGVGFDIPFVNRCSAQVGSELTPPVGENFPSVTEGVMATGTCDALNGWVERRNLVGGSLYPRMRCVSDSSPTAIPGYGVYDQSTLTNTCVRRDCNFITAGDPYLVGAQIVYSNNYALSESGECKGYRHGFANWPQYTPDPALDPSTYIATAHSCIAGFKPFGSTASRAVPTGPITHYSGGQLPDRICELTGHFGDFTDESINSSDTSCGTPPTSSLSVTQTKGCERITCPARNPPIPTGVSDVAAWSQWFANEGASFPAVNASRSMTAIFDESKSYGTCNTSLGFSQAAGGTRPYYECDYLGNAGPIQNPCIRISCDAVVTDPDSNNLNHGFAKWDEVTNSQMRAAITASPGTSASILVNYNGTCHPGYIPNPYPPATNVLGAPLPAPIASDLTRPAQPPKRYCIGGLDSSGNIVKIWRSVHNPCINKCPGGKDSANRTLQAINTRIAELEAITARDTAEQNELDTLKTNRVNLDDRIGVGRTIHSVSSAIDSSGSVQIHWPAADLGQTVYETNYVGDPATMNASMFTEDGPHQVYLLKRVCGSDGRWEEPVPMCSANHGMILGASINVAGIANGHENSVQSYTPTQRSAIIGDPTLSATFDSIQGQCTLSHISNPAERSRLLGIISSLPNSEPILYCRRDSANINEVYYDIHDPSSTFCNSCPQIYPASPVNIPGFSAPPLTALSEDRRYYPGEQIAAQCNADTDYALISSVPAPANPGLKCDIAGSGSWTAENIASCKRSCDFTSSNLINQTLSTGSSQCPSTVTYSISSDMGVGDVIKIKHGERFEFNAYNTCRLSYLHDFGTGSMYRSVCNSWRYSMMCNDGSFVINQDLRTRYGSCEYNEYNYLTGSWNTPIRMPISTNQFFVSYLHLPRTDTLSTGLGMMATDNTLKDITVNCVGCPGGVRSRGVTPGAIATRHSSSPTTPFDWDDIDVDDSSIYDPAIGADRSNNCREYVYRGLANISSSSFNTSVCPSSGCSPGQTINAPSCLPDSISIDPLPSITCSSSGMWILNNENNCIRRSFDYGLLSAGTSVPVTLDGTPNGLYDPSQGPVSESFNNSPTSSGSGTNTCPMGVAGNIISRGFTIRSGKQALVIVDLHNIDNEFDIKINGHRIYGADGACGSIEAAGGHSSAGDTYITTIYPWATNTNIDPSDPSGNNLARIRVVLFGGEAQFYKTNSSSSTRLERDFPVDSSGARSDFRVPVIGPGNHEIQVINYDGPGPDGMQGRIYIYEI